MTSRHRATSNRYGWGIYFSRISKTGCSSDHNDILRVLLLLLLYAQQFGRDFRIHCAGNVTGLNVDREEVNSVDIVKTTHVR